MKKFIFVLPIAFVFAFFSVHSVLAGERLTAEEEAQVRAMKQPYIDAYKECARNAKEGDGSIDECNATFQAALKQIQKDWYSGNRTTTQTTTQQVVRENIVEKKMEIGDITDERKQEVVTNIVEKMNSTNARWTAQWSNVLTRLQQLLAKIESRADLAEAAGQDVSSVREAIDQADAAISEAQVALEAQAAKEYTLEITDEATLGETVRNAMSTLQSDLKSVKELILDARQAVREALTALKQIPQVDTLEE